MARHDVFDKCGDDALLLVEISDLLRPCEDHDGPIVHAHSETGPSGDDGIHQRHRDARGRAGCQGGQQLIVRAAVDIDVMVDSNDRGRYDARLPIDDDADVTNERLVDNAIDDIAVIGGSLGSPADAGIVRNGDRRHLRCP